ncbi:EPIDERMAL PATTERNING FACTOR-like protein 1 [Salvia miltiorrhiza]|uniref:EPIDERMAL PATTERNING FACTOR-like protein 1 n=1 Tax=Salvia miltiorrhiza TaxID=226208 RepID=UPI0025AC7163|nr:EPIDERMAL PATTERNING FACTOR-like protein 1 [Salvia miltiorrhiza]
MFITAPLISANSIAFIIALFFLLHSSHSSLSSTGLLAEEKARLGSTPPSCQNRCNLCHPCMAVQVPTTPSPSRGRLESDQNRYSNYKPLGWKCRCQGHFYNP